MSSESLNNHRQLRSTDSAAVANLAAYKRWAREAIQQRPYYSVVIPTYNEEIRVLPTIGAIATHMSSLNKPWELIIADDGSSDTTVQLVEELGLVNMRVLRAEKNGGKGSAVRRGMLAAKGELILFADADQSTPIEQVEHLEEVMAKGFPVVIGSRAAEGASVDSKSWYRKLLSTGLRIYLKMTLRLPVTDTQCGFKLFTSDAVDQLFTRQRLDGFSFDLEILYLARKRGIRMIEVPVRWIDAPGSKVDSVTVVLQFIRDVITILRNDLKGTYKEPIAVKRAPTNSTDNGEISKSLQQRSQARRQ